MIQNTSFTEDSVDLAVQWCPLSQKSQLKRRGTGVFEKTTIIVVHWTVS